MARFAVKTLEFDKVKAMLAGKTATSLGKAQSLGCFFLQALNNAELTFRADR